MSNEQKGRALPRGPHPLDPQLAFYREHMAGLIRRAGDVLAALQSHHASYSDVQGITNRMAELMNLGRRLLSGKKLTPEIRTMVMSISAKLQRSLDAAVATLPTEEPKQ